MVHSSSLLVYVSVSKEHGRLLRCSAAVIYRGPHSLSELRISFVHNFHIIFCLKLKLQNLLLLNDLYLLTNWTTVLHSLNESKLLMFLH